jgi:polar amino acid transport system substrate-binding protein
MLQRAELVRTDGEAAAADLLRTGRAHARAAARLALLEEAAMLHGSRVLDDGFGAISFAALVPKGHPGRLAYVGEFVEEAKASGLVRRAIESAGLRGVEVAPPGSPSPR